VFWSLAVLLVFIQRERRPDLEPSPLPKLGLIHKLYFVTLLVCKSTALVANGSSNVCRVAGSLVRRPVGVVCGARTVSLWLSEGQNTLWVEEVPQVCPEWALCACVSVSRGSVEEPPPLLRGIGSIGDLLGPGGGTGVDRGLRRAAAARTDGTAAYDVLSELQDLELTDSGSSVKLLLSTRGEEDV
jgi:hypothetical protein